MFITRAFLLSVSLVGVANAAACPANNCARAVTGTRNKDPSLASRSADCGSFLLAIATPSPVTVTGSVTQTVRINPTTTLSPEAQPKRAKRSDGAPPAGPSAATVPAYASACSNAAQYASACSCFDLTASTTTLAPATVTVAPTATYGCVDPGVCGGITKHYPCPGTGFGNNQYCLCVLDTDGSSFCTPEGESCEELADCGSDADCASGLKCQVNTCCGGGNKCTSDIAEFCKDPSLAVFI